MNRVLVTGASGSFGRAFVSHLLEHRLAAEVCVFSRDELKQAEMRQQLPSEAVRWFIGDVRDYDRLRMAMAGCEVVVHAAALKRIDTIEYNPFEAVQTNVIGAQNVIRAAIACGVQTVVALSTDKAAAPLTMYGATKLCAERMFVAAGAYAPHGPRFAVVRYGNVAGSRGSLIPFWRELIRAGKRQLPLTDERMTRFWIAMHQAVGLVRHAIAQTYGGEIFVPVLPRFYVRDLAAAFDLPTYPVGIRGQEKLAEVLISEDEAPYFEEGEACGSLRVKVRRLDAAFSDARGPLSSDRGQMLPVLELRRLVEELP